MDINSTIWGKMSNENRYETGYPSEIGFEKFWYAIRVIILGFYNDISPPNDHSIGDNF